MTFLEKSPRGRYRICINSRIWEEERNNEFGRALELVGDEEQKRIGQFKFRKDAKTALIGRLILHTMVCKTTGLHNSDLLWKRTDKGKPYLDPSCFENLSPELACPAFSYNISHSGHWVVGASEFDVPVGIDINDYGLRPNNRIDFDADPDTDAEENLPILQKYFVNFKHVWSPPEAAYMKKIRFDFGESQLIDFSRFWTLKESFVKVFGLGFSFDVSRLHFDFTAIPQRDIPKHPDTVNAVPIKVSVDGKDESPDWQFEQFGLDRYHLVTVALHIRDITGLSSERQEKITSLHPVPILYLTPLDLIQYLESIN